MDKETVKLLLASYRPQDAGDPIFAEALAEVARDPELAAWFAETQRFDAALRGKFEDAPVVPAGVTTRILLGTQPSRAAPRIPRWGWALATAAALALAATLGWRTLAPRPAAEALAQQAIAFTDAMPVLQFVCFEASAVAGWINKQPGAQQARIALPKPGKSANMTMIGSSVVDWNGRPVVMIALQNGRRMAMLYMLSADDAKALAEGASETFERDGWVVRTSRSDGQLRLLTTKGRAQDLDFQVPF